MILFKGCFLFSNDSIYHLRHASAYLIHCETRHRYHIAKRQKLEESMEIRVLNHSPTHRAIIEQSSPVNCEFYIYYSLEPLPDSFYSFVLFRRKLAASTWHSQTYGIDAQPIPRRVANSPTTHPILISQRQGVCAQRLIKRKECI